jgi:NADP-reducing hydrogenase subunit HndC
MEFLSNCGLGQTASVAVRDILKHFREEVEEHIRDGVCRAGVCNLAEHQLKVQNEAAVA